MKSEKVKLPVGEIVARYKSGESARTLGKAYGVSDATIVQRLRASGCPVRNLKESREVQALKLPVGEIVARYKAGESAEKLGEAYGVSRETILCRLRKSGCPIRKVGDNGAPRKYDWVALATRYWLGESFEDICSDVGVSKKRLREILKKLDCPIRSERYLTEDQRDGIILLYDMGMKVKDIAEKMGVSVATTYNVRKAANPPRVRRRR